MEAIMYFLYYIIFAFVPCIDMNLCRCARLSHHNGRSVYVSYVCEFGTCVRPDWLVLVIMSTFMEGLCNTLAHSFTFCLMGRCENNNQTSTTNFSIPKFYIVLHIKVEDWTPSKFAEIDIQRRCTCCYLQITLSSPFLEKKHIKIFPSEHLDLESTKAVVNKGSNFFNVLYICCFFPYYTHEQCRVDI